MVSDALKNYMLENIHRTLRNLFSQGLTILSCIWQKHYGVHYSDSVAFLCIHSVCECKGKDNNEVTNIKLY